jgi:ribosomal protein S18 acetylase RimI-like enzyme
MEIRELLPSELDSAALLLSRGMQENPNNLAAFGGNAERRRKLLAVFFQKLLPAQNRRGAFLGAFDASTLLGVCGMAEPGRCQPGLGEKLRIATGLLANGAPGVLLRVSRWGGGWAREDPREPHWHLGPVAVDAHLQGRGVGGALLAEFCRRMDERGTLAYLETDKIENTAFYRKYGFVVKSEGCVLGVPNWYMSRRAHADMKNTAR